MAIHDAGNFRLDLLRIGDVHDHPFQALLQTGECLGVAVCHHHGGTFVSQPTGNR